jgi:chromosomal replication initiator protein
MVEEVVKFLTDASTDLTSKAVGELVSSKFGVSLDELRSRSRKRSIAFPRQVAMYLCRKHTEDTLADIGKLFRRDHSTVMHAVKVVSELSRRDTTVSSQLRILSDKLEKL